MKCEICGGEMGTGGCWTAWKHPQAPLIQVVASVADADLKIREAAAMAALQTRAERAERQAAALAKAVEQVFAERATWAGDSGARCICGCDDDMEALRAALRAYREGR